VSGQDVGARIGAVIGFYTGGPAHTRFPAMISPTHGGFCDSEVGELPLPDEGESA
jgi:hypothetical protein